MRFRNLFISYIYNGGSYPHPEGCELATAYLSRHLMVGVSVSLLNERFIIFSFRTVYEV